MVSKACSMSGTGLRWRRRFFTWATANSFITMLDLVREKYQFVLSQVSLVAGKGKRHQWSLVDIQFLDNALL